MDFQLEATLGMLKPMRASQGVGVKRPRSVMPSRIRVAFPRREHVEGLAEGELAHEVEGEVVEPGCYVYRRA